MTRILRNTRVSREKQLEPSQFRSRQIFAWLYTLSWVAAFVWLYVVRIPTWWKVVIFVVLVFGQPDLRGLFWTYKDYLEDFKRRGNTG